MWYNNITTNPGKNHLCLAERLTQTSEFQKAGLRLFCGISALDLKLREAPPPDKSWRCDYLFCQGRNALLAVTLTPKEQDGGARPAAPPGLPVLNFSGVSEDAVDAISSAVSQALNTRQHDEDAPATDWTVFVSERSTKGLERDLDDFVRHHLLKLTGHQRWEPTQFGLACGVRPCYEAVQHKYKSYTIRCYPYCSYAPSDLLAVYDVLQWPDKAEAEARWKKSIPFDQRTERLKQGLPSDNAYSAYVVRQMADMPLDIYLQAYPEDLAELRKLLPELKDGATYQDAAVLIYQLSQPPWPKALSGLTIDCCKPMQLLAKPLVEEWQRLAAG